MNSGVFLPPWFWVRAIVSAKQALTSNLKVSKIDWEMQLSISASAEATQSKEYALWPERSLKTAPRRFLIQEMLPFLDSFQTRTTSAYQPTAFHTERLS